MLRLLVLVLVLSNAIYFAWSQDYLRPYGFGPAQQSEPQRLTQQIQPEAIQILTPAEASRQETAVRTPAPPTQPPECLLAGLFDEAQTGPLQQALEAGLPQGSWALEPVRVPARWIIYMGRYRNEQQLSSKKAELANLRLKYEPLYRADFSPGLSLGAFETEEEAKAGLRALNKRGIRTARVVLERAEVRGSQLRIATADEALKVQLEEIKPALGDKALKSCP